MFQSAAVTTWTPGIYSGPFLYAQHAHFCMLSIDSRHLGTITGVLVHDIAAKGACISASRRCLLFQAYKTSTKILYVRDAALFMAINVVHCNRWVPKVRKVLAKIFARLIANLLLARRFVKEQSRGTTYVSVILIGRVGQSMDACLDVEYHAVSPQFSSKN